MYKNISSSYPTDFFINTFLLFLVFLLLLPGVCRAATNIPEPLQPWVSWVLDSQAELRCTHINSGGERTCVWPEPVAIDLNDKGGSFRQSWQMEARGWIVLPGSDKYWPQAVLLNGLPALVVKKGGRPAIYIEEAGHYEVKGGFSWSEMPELLPLSPGTAIVAPFTVNGREELYPVLNGNQLWLAARQDKAKGKSEDAVSTQVFRLLEDTVPMQITTRIELQVSGRSREVVLGWHLPANQIPVVIKSNLPARLEKDGRLRVQVKAGSHVLEFVSRVKGMVNDLTIGEVDESWPRVEYWSFVPRNNFRQVKIEGVPAVDPVQVGIPREWQHYPAYRVGKSDKMIFKTIKRGDADPAPNQISLSRTFWLDDAGSGMTVKDEISGRMVRDRRLEVKEPFQLGRMTIGGRDQLITRLPDSDSVGVEVRQGEVNAVAVSRLDKIESFPAVGWQQSVKNLRAVINLPPGWDLLHVNGVDRADTWLSKWTLLDIFVTMIISLAFARLFGFLRGGLMLVTMVLIFHDATSPVYIWLAILAVVGLLRLVKKGGFYKFLQISKYTLFLILLLSLISYSVAEIKQGLYPQLAFNSYSYGDDGFNNVKSVPVQAEEDVISQDVQQERSSGKMSSLVKKGKTSFSYGSTNRYESKQNNIKIYDDNAMIQSGPGLPSWKWKKVFLSWSGPVAENQSVRIYLLSPRVNMVLSFVKVLFLFALFWLVVGVGFKRRNSRKEKKDKKGKKENTASSFAVSVLFLAFMLIPSFALCNSFPDKEMLSDLKQRLAEPPGCFPDCSGIDSLKINITDSTVTLEMKVNSQAKSSLFLPNSKDIFWSSVHLSGKAALVYRTKKGIVTVLPVGINFLEMTGHVRQNSFALSLPEVPGKTYFSSESWSISGLQDGFSGGQLRFDKLAREEQAGEKLRPSALPPFIQVERTLKLGLEWQVETVVRRLSPPGQAVFLNIPLLDDEKVLSGDILPSEGMVKLDLQANELEKRWLSMLPQRSKVILTAPAKEDWYEVWKLDASPLWHVKTAGITPIHQYGGGVWNPEWRPYPKEKVELFISRPEAVQGRTRTIDQSKLVVKPGLRATDVSLALQIRSTRGDRQKIVLPKGSDLQEVKLNGRLQPISLEDNVLLVPLNPGKQDIEISWRMDRGVDTIFRTPKVDLEMDSVNSNIEVVPGNRWVLFVSGPRLGPAVLFYGELLVIVLLAFILGFVKISPLKWYHWLLLGLGLSQSGLLVNGLVVAWFIAFHLRAKFSDKLLGSGWFNISQFFLLVLSLISFAALLYAVRNGLLGHPDMLIAGNGSSNHLLKWYQDRIGGEIPRAMLFSVPMVVYRAVMLVWALWLAVSFLKWLKWGWDCFSSGDIWKKVEWKKSKKSKKSKNDKKDSEEMEYEIDI